MAAPTLRITKGKTFGPLCIRVEKETIVYKAITGINKVAPIRITVPGHGLVAGWRAAVTGVKGMLEINAKDPQRLRDSDYHAVTVVDANTIEFNDVDASDFGAYTSGGYVQYRDYYDLSGKTARMAVKQKSGTSNLLKCSVGGVSGSVKPDAAGADGSVVWVTSVSGTPGKEWVPGAAYVADAVVDLTDLLRLTTENGRITIDSSAKTITLQVSASDTAAIDWKRGEYDIELVSSDATPVVRSLFGEIGNVLVSNEVTNN